MKKFKKKERNCINEYIEKEKKCLSHYNRGVYFHNKGKIYEAIREYHRALNFVPNMAEALNNLHVAYTEIGNDEMAYFFARRVFEVLSELVEEKEIMEDLLELPENSASMLAGCGATLMNNKDPDTMKCLELALRIEPENWLARYNLGIYYLDEGLIEDALREFQIAYKVKKDDHDIVLNLSCCYGILNMEENAVELIEEYLNFHPSTPDLLAVLATAYVNLNRTEDAISVCEQWIQLEPDSPSAHACIALGYAILGRREDAYQEVATAIKLNEKIHDEAAEDWIKRTLEILEDPDDNLNPLFFLLLLAMMKARRKRLAKKID